MGPAFAILQGAAVMSKVAHIVSYMQVPALVLALAPHCLQVF